MLEILERAHKALSVVGGELAIELARRKHVGGAATFRRWALALRKVADELWAYADTIDDEQF